jgi:hypothetical protein
MKPDAVQPSDQPMRFSPDDVLPPVEPPNLAFVRQLVLIPLLIVSLIVGGWLFFNWLASGSGDPDKMLHEIGRYGDSGWQSASNLAQMLSRPDKQYAEMRQDPAFAKKLADLLHEKSKDPFGDRAKEVPRLKLCYYLCRALGCLETDAVLPPLLEAAERERSPAEVDVRLGAIEGLTTLANKLGPEKVRSSEEAIQGLLECSRASDENAEPQEGQSADYKPHGEVRATAAFALGVIGGDKATDRLVLMLDDPYAPARYNAATALSQQGDARAMPVLLEMLDPAGDKSAKDERYETDQQKRLITVVKNAIDCSVHLTKKAPEAGFEALVKAIRKIDEEGCPEIKDPGANKALRMHAHEALARMK